MSRLVQHRFEVGQVWVNPGYTLYIMAVNEDYEDESGEKLPGKIAVTTSKPFPGRKFTATDLAPDQMENVIVKGGYKLAEKGWAEEFALQAQAIKDAQAKLPPQKPVEAPQLSGLGAMMD